MQLAASSTLALGRCHPFLGVRRSKLRIDLELQDQAGKDGFVDEEEDVALFGPRTDRDSRGTFEQPCRLGSIEAMEAPTR